MGKIARHWSDVSSKVLAAAAGGSAATLVQTVLVQVFPDWHPNTFVTGLITAAVAVGSAYLKGERTTLTVTAGDEETTLTLPDLPEDVRTQIESE